MPAYHNIETTKSPFGNYRMAYSGSRRFKVSSPGTYAKWVAREIGGNFANLHANTLGGISTLLEQLDGSPYERKVTAK